MPLETFRHLNIHLCQLNEHLVPLMTMISLSSGKQGPGTLFLFHSVQVAQ